MYWYTGPTFWDVNPMLITIVITTVIYILIIITDNSKKLSKIAITISVLGFLFSFVPSYATCYVFDLNQVLNKRGNETNYYSWDKYSWFLYIRGQDEKAIQANQNAIDAWYKSKERFELNDSDTLHLKMLEEHKEGIKNHTWTGGDIRFQKK
jgi:hypothetical protein